MGDIDLADQNIMRERQMHGACRRAGHLHQRAAKQMVEVAARVDRGREAGDRRRECGIVERLGAGVLETAQAFHGDRDLAAHDEHARGIGERRRHRGDHVAEARSADAERRAEAAAGTGIAVGHVGGAAFLRGDDRLERRKARERREERIDQPARDHEEVRDALADEGIEEIVGAAGHVGLWRSEP